ncbi:MAG: penicillin-binding protein 2 [Patescibacteria group bacterium]
MKIYIKKFRKRQSNPFSIKEGKFRDSKLEAGYRLQWTEEGILGQREAETPGEQMGRNIARQKIFWLVIFLITGFSFLFIKTAYLQIAQRDSFQRLSQNNRIREQRLPADRGVIYDSQHKVLAYNTPVFYLEIIPADVHNSDYEEVTGQSISNVIGNILGKEIIETVDYLLIKNKKTTMTSYQPQVVVENIEYNQALQLIMLTKDMPGVSVQIRAQRHYDLSALSLSHILGYTGIITAEEYENKNEQYSLIDYLGKTGIEKIWENELRGQHGSKYIEVDALGKEKRIINQQEKQDGYNLVLSIDVGLQQKIETEVLSQLKKIGAQRAAVVALDPRNGEVLAMVSTPSFNVNDFAHGIDSDKYSNLINNSNLPLFNRAVSGEFPTGSTFKPVVVAAALQENIITKNTKFNSTGGISVKSWFFPDWKTGGHGLTDARKALAWSVNTFFYYIGGGYPSETGLREEFTGLGVEKITGYARLFGLGAPLGIDLPNEASGFLPSKSWKEEVKKELWYIGDTYHLAIGQGDITATPLQVASYTAFFANQGKLYKPHVVKELLNSDNTLAKKIEPEILRYDFIDQENINTVRQGMRDAVEYGSVSSMQIVPVAVAGKTGTAQWSSTKNTHSWFTGFAPFDNPEIAITVIVEEGGEASDAAVPIARRVLQWYFSQS